MKMKKWIGFLVMMTMVFALSVPALAASSSKTVTSSGIMGLYLEPSESGDSNVITFNVSGLPQNAVVTKVIINVGGNVTWSGSILPNKIFIKNSSMTNYVSVPWGSIDGMEITTGLVGKPAAGTWSVYYNGTNLSKSNVGAKSYGGVKLTVYYNY